MSIPASYIERSKVVFAAYARILFETDAQIAARLTGVTAAGSAATISKTAHGFATSDRVLFVEGTGFTGLTAGEVYYAINKTADTFELAETPTATTGITISVAGSAGIFEKVHVYNCEPLNDESGTPELEQLMRRGSDGIATIVEEEIKSYAASWSFDLDEAMRVLDLFGGKLNGNVSGYATIYIRDTKDESGKVRLKSERFYSSIIRDGAASFGGGAFTKPKMKITAKKQDGSQVAWTSNATVAV